MKNIEAEIEYIGYDGKIPINISSDPKCLIDFEKLINVIESCITIEHVHSTMKYIENFCTKWNIFESHEPLNTILGIHCDIKEITELD